MRALLTFALSLVGFSAAAATYNITVETFVAGRLEDKFSFNLSEEKFQEKGFDTKILAKRYRAAGWIHPDIIQRDAEEKEKIAQTEQASAPKKTPLEIAKEKLEELETEYSKADRRIERSRDKLAILDERIKMLKDAVEKGARNTGAFQSAYKSYLDRYEPKEEIDENYERLLRNRPKNTGDVEEVLLGSYCRMKLVKENEKSIRVDLDYAYSRVLSFFYSDGNNNDNSITKHPIFERFERLGLQNVKLIFSKPYCIQIGRPSPEEARTLQDALAATTIFSNMGGIPEGQRPAPIKPTYAASELDAQGSYAEIKQKYALDSGKTLRVVITAKKMR